ncbi:MAG: hypothetical protein JW757_06320 [Anaerolineales bacterium]|nr:hypothetical protein [Anaerolineales bacterium]
MTRIRNKEINRRRQRRKRIGKLKEKLAAAKTEAERELIINQIKKRLPFFDPSKK